jgi:hypothetical protein
MPKTSREDLLTPEQAVEALFGRVSAAAIRKRVREGALRCHWQQKTPGKIFVKRRELEELYHEQLYGWVATARKRKKIRAAPRSKQLLND